MKKLLHINNLSFLVSVIVLTIVSVFHSFMYSGLIEDGAYRFFEALTCKNIFLGPGGFPIFPYNLRYFSGIYSHLAVGFSLHYFDIHNIKYLLYIFTFVSYFKFLIILAVIYLNLPKNKKNNFEIILLSFLLTFTFTSYQIWAENLITGLFIWVLFAIFYYVEFNELTLFNKICIVVFSAMLISSHQMVLVFIPVLFIIALNKHMRLHNLAKSSQIVLISGYVFFLAAIVFNIYGALDLFAGTPKYAGQTQKYMSIMPLFHDYAFVIICLFVGIILFLSFFKNDKKYDNVKYFITAVFIYFIFKLLLFEVPTENKFANITLPFHLPLFFFVLIIFAGFFKIKMEHKYIRLINLTLCLVIYLNTIHYGLMWKLYLTNINQYIKSNKQITVAYCDEYNGRYPAYPILEATREDVLEIVFPEQYSCVHSDYILYILIFMQGLFGKYNPDRFIKIKTPSEYVCNDTNHPTTYFIIQRKEKLKKFAIDIDSIISVNNRASLE